MPGDARRSFGSGALLGVVATLLIVSLLSGSNPPPRPSTGTPLATPDARPDDTKARESNVGAPGSALLPGAPPSGGVDDEVNAALGGGAAGGVVRTPADVAAHADVSLDDDTPTAEELRHPGNLSLGSRRLDEMMDAVARSPELQHHRSFVAMRARMLRKLALARASSVLRNGSSGGAGGCVEFLRLREQPSDNIYRVPCVGRALPGLHSVRHAPFGLIATFRHREYGGDAGRAAEAPRTDGEGDTTVTAAPSPPRAPSGPLRVAVEMSGHMRTYRRCAASTRKEILASTGGLLFIATYPDIGDKRFGIRVQEQDDAVDVAELRELYGAEHLAAAYLVDLPAARARLMRGFPTLFVLKQWSWMIYQLFMMELAHNTTAAHIGASDVETSFGGQPYIDHVERFGSGDTRFVDSWGGNFDVFVRVRPDLYILGTVRFERVDTTSGVVGYVFECGGQAYPRIDLNATDVLRSPHHPKYLWPRDPLSDHSAMGQPAAMNTFLRLFSDTVFRDPQAQEKRVFYHGQTAEKLWGEHAERQNLAVKRVPGWHLMLRNAAKFTNATLHASAFKAKLISIIFGATDPNVGCPAINNCITVLTHKPKKLTGGGRKSSVKPGFTGQDCG